MILKNATGKSAGSEVITLVGQAWKELKDHLDDRGWLVPWPEIRETPLSSIPSLIHDEDQPGFPAKNKEHDVFISHASEDKDDIVTHLVNALKDEGVDVWYDEFELRIGDDLRQKIDQGLANSKVGLVVFSKSFFDKKWPNYELGGIAAVLNMAKKV